MEIKKQKEQSFEEETQPIRTSSCCENVPLGFPLRVGKEQVTIQKKQQQEVLQPTLIHYGVWKVKCLPDFQLCLLQLNHVLPKKERCYSCTYKKNWIVKYIESDLEKDINARLMELKPQLILKTYIAGNALIMHEGIPLSLCSFENASCEKIQVFIKECFISLYELHELHILHRDIKPSNLVLDPSRHYKLCFIDFGNSRYRDPSPRLTSRGVVADDLKNFSIEKAFQDACSCTYAFACPYQLNDIRMRKRGASYLDLEFKKEVWSMGMSLFTVLCRNNTILYVYTPEEEDVKVCTTMLYRLATRFPLPTSEKSKNAFQSIWSNLQTASTMQSENAKQERQWLLNRSSYMIQQALVWDIEMRPNVTELLQMGGICFPSFRLTLSSTNKRKRNHANVPLILKKKSKLVAEEKLENPINQVEMESSCAASLSSSTPPRLSWIVSLANGNFPYETNFCIGKNIHVDDRFRVLDWMFSVVVKENLELQLWFLAVQLLDRFLLTTRIRIRVPNLIILGGVCILLMAPFSDLSEFQMVWLYECIVGKGDVGERVSILKNYISTHFQYRIWEPTPLLDIYVHLKNNNNNNKPSKVEDMLFQECQNIYLGKKTSFSEVIQNKVWEIEKYFQQKLEKK